MADVLITGCNRGIGLELCRLYKDRGDQVIGVCRTTSPDLEALDIRVIDGIDVSDRRDIEKLQQMLGDQSIDILLNNAGILRGDEFSSLDFDAMLEQFRVNALGPLRVTHALVDNLREGSRVAIVSSRVGSIADNSSGNNYGYRMSKAAVNMAGMNLRHDLEPRGISVALLHPGLVATEMTGGRGITPVASAAGLIDRIDALDLDSSGGFWHAEGYTLPW
ncbi:MAG: SDR family oxidoreductase [Gammaproteobacteria bacterium]|nr:SDR family oxidoreductase [Gammaproteobacteria bacterium]